MESDGTVSRICSLRCSGIPGIRQKKRPGRNTTWPLGRIRPQETTSRCNYFLAVGGGGASLVCAQAPSPKALAITTAIMITFKNFNLYRLLSQQVAPVCLDRELPRGNAFLNLFERGHNRVPDSTSSNRSCPRPWSLSLSFERKHQNSKQWPKQPQS